MNIDERIRLEKNRHYEKIKELNELLKMYNNSERDYSTYVERNVDQAVNHGVNSDKIVSYVESRQSVNHYTKQIEEIMSDLEKENDLHERNMAYLMKQKEEIERQKIKEEIAKEQEKQQREIESLTLLQEINKIENEIIEIEKRIKQISSETLGSFFTKQVFEKYPTEYQTFKQQDEQVRKHRSSYAQITDLKEKINEVSQDLQFYKGVLPVYESFYQRFEQMKTEMNQAQVNEEEQARIYNLIHKAENERLQKSRSLYTAWDLGSKIIPPEYQGMTYEEVETILKQKEVEEQSKQEAKSTRDELIGKAIRKYLNVQEDYHLSQIQIQNLSQEFAGYSNEELKEYISGEIGYIKKDVKLPSRNELISKIIGMFDEFELKFISTSIAEKKLNEMPLTKLEELSESKSQCLDLLIPPIQRIRLEGTVLLSISNYDELTDEDKSKYRNAYADFTTEQLFEQYKRNIKEKIVDDGKKKVQEDTLKRDKLISDILGAMLNAGEFHNSGLDIIEKMSDLEYAKSELQTKSLEELEFILSVYTPQQEEVDSTSGKKR